MVFRTLVALRPLIPRGGSPCSFFVKNEIRLFSFFFFFSSKFDFFQKKKSKFDFASSSLIRALSGLSYTVKKSFFRLNFVQLSFVLRLTGESSRCQWKKVSQKKFYTCFF